MGKRVAVSSAAATYSSQQHHQQQHVSTPTCTRTIRKRKRNTTNGITISNATVYCKNLRLNTASSSHWHENDDEDSSSNDTTRHRVSTVRSNQSNKHANNSSILLNTSSLNNSIIETSVNESPKPVYTLHPSVVNGTILHDLTQKSWRLGRPIGKGNFGEIFLASDNITIPVTNENAKFVVKIEPHSNGPLFVEIHCLMNTAKKNSDNEEGSKASHAKMLDISPSGIPDYIASGSHLFGNARYRFLVLQRFDRDLHSLIKNCRVQQKSVLTLAIQIVNVLENLHDKGYCHNDVKAQNLMISKCKYYKKKQNLCAASSNGNGKSHTAPNAGIKVKYDNYEEKQQTTDSGNSSEQEINDNDDVDFVMRRKLKYDEDDEDEDFDDGSTSNSSSVNNMDIYHTPVNKHRKKRNAIIEFSGSNPVRSCRRQKRNSIYEEMVKSHYLRPTKRISYTEFFNEDVPSVKRNANENHLVSSGDESEEFVPHSTRRSNSNKKFATKKSATKRLTRGQEKLLTISASRQRHHQHQQQTELFAVEEERIFLIDFGLASKFMDNGVHRPFVMDQRRAHDGTLEFTSRDAHMGAHSRRSDLECLGYNLIFWSQGYLPWKDSATQHQQEKVHRAKEYLMTDVREMLRQIYGKQVPKYLGEFLHCVGQLAYHERPDYARYRRIFEREYQQLGYSSSDMHLDSHEITHTCVRVKEEIENKNDIFEMNKHNSGALSIMKNLSVGTPFHERTLSNRVSPKNLRSKSDKKSTKKKKFSWAEVLSQDPDQIARERAEKEFDREEELSEVQQPTVRRYEGKPTYAILEIEHRLKMSGRLMDEENDNAMDNDVVINDDEEMDENEEEQEDVEIAEEYYKEEEDDEEDESEDEVNGEDDENENQGMTEEEQESEDETEENDHEDEEMDTDASEISEQQVNSGRNRRTRNTIVKTRTTKKTTSTRKHSPLTNTSIGVPHTRGKTQRTVKISKTTTMQTTHKRSATVTKVISQKNGSRGSVTRIGRKLIGTGCGERSANHKAIAYTVNATGENEHRSTKNIENRHGMTCDGGNGVKLPERRTRRCLIKTDAEVEEESNSNFSPDVRRLFNVWKKINNESIYFKGNAAAAVTAAGAQRHYKK